MLGGGGEEKIYNKCHNFETAKKNFFKFIKNETAKGILKTV